MLTENNGNLAGATPANPLNESGIRIDEILESGALDSLLKSITMKAQPTMYAPWQMRKVIAGDVPLRAKITEIVDNSSDAGASNISIVLSDRGSPKKKNSGGNNNADNDFLKSIAFIDDGCGFVERSFKRWIYEIETSENGEKRSRNSVGHFGIGSTRLSWESERTLLVTRSRDSEVRMALRDKNMGTTEITGKKLQEFKSILGVQDDFVGTMVLYLGIWTNENGKWLGEFKTEELRKYLVTELGLRYGHILPGYRVAQPKAINLGIVGRRCVTEKNEDTRAWDVSALDYLLKTPQDIKDGYVPIDEKCADFIINSIRVGTFHAVIHDKELIRSKSLNKKASHYNFAISSEKTHISWRGTIIGSLRGVGTGQVHNTKNHLRVILMLDDNQTIDDLTQLGITFNSTKTQLEIAEGVEKEIRGDCDIFVKSWSLKSAKQGTNSRNQELEKAKQRTGDFKKRNTTSVVGHGVAGHTRSLDQGQFGVDSVKNPPSDVWRSHLRSQWKNLGATTIQGNPFDSDKIRRDDVIDDDPYFGPGVCGRDGTHARFKQLLMSMRYGTTLKTLDVDDAEVEALEHVIGSILETAFHTVYNSLCDEARPMYELMISQTMGEIFKSVAYVNKHDNASANMLAKK